MSDAHTFLAGLASAGAASDHWPRIDQAVARGEWAWLDTVAGGLTTEPSVPTWARGSLATRIHHGLTERAEPTALELLVRVLLTADRPALRDVASRLATAQTPTDLEALAARHAPVSAPESTRELIACLLHELVLRDVDVERGDWRTWIEHLASTSHPLAWLPLSRAPFELDIAFPSYGIGASCFSRDQRTGPEIDPDDEPAPELLDITTPADQERLQAAAADWLERSHGLAESYVARLATPATRWTNALALSLKLTCMAHPDVHILQASPRTVFRDLFAAASLGGAYSDGLAGAWGRMAAWRSLGALAGAPPDASSEQVAAAALACQWVGMACGDWFKEWTLGVAALRPDGASVAALAATDTD